jgi:multiple sugar transport system ATP-binding protein
VLDVTEQMGMDTLVYFDINETQVCGRVSPKAGAQVGDNVRLLADMNNMHLIDDESGNVL